VVVVAHFPKGTAAQFAKGKGGALFEQANEFAQVAPVMDAFGKDVHVVRHQAKRMQTKRTASSTFQQGGEKALGDGLFPEVGCAPVAADRNEVSLSPQVIGGREPPDVPIHGHGFVVVAGL
jgi:hypothetical protein